MFHYRFHFSSLGPWDMAFPLNFPRGEVSERLLLCCENWPPCFRRVRGTFGDDGLGTATATNAMRALAIWDCAPSLTMYFLTASCLAPEVNPAHAWESRGCLSPPSTSASVRKECEPEEECLPDPETSR